ncbi:MAG: hypothetical protein HOQ24_08900, partial [Mycobacteriaceae bacterium]|nr:hypothetical protein [Mycobacteriaceae bacterium]
MVPHYGRQGPGVDAMAARSAPPAARIGPVAIRAEASVPAGTLAYDTAGLVTGWHHHDLHQLEYALEGVA